MLEAVLNTTGKKCGYKGHFEKDYFWQPCGTKYSPIPDEEEKKEDTKWTNLRSLILERKKEKKNKHRDRKSSDSDSSDSESDMGKR
ncbi:Hypothetical predicted protein, partial [Marmota monax]